MSNPFEKDWTKEEPKQELATALNEGGAGFSRYFPQATVGVVGGSTFDISSWSPVVAKDASFVGFNSPSPTWRGDSLSRLNEITASTSSPIHPVNQPQIPICAYRDFQMHSVIVEFPIERVKLATALGMVDGCIHLWSSVSTELVKLGFALESERTPLVEKSIGKLFSILHDHMDKGQDWRQLHFVVVGVEVPVTCTEEYQTTLRARWSQEVAEMEYHPIERLATKTQAATLSKMIKFYDSGRMNEVVEKETKSKPNNQINFREFL